MQRSNARTSKVFTPASHPKGYSPTSPVVTLDNRFGADLTPDGFLRLESPEPKKRKPVSLPSVSILKG